MAVMTGLQKNSEGHEITTKKHAKSHYKTRPITATLEHPLILDIKLLKKLDMTTFTKKGLIALSKFCGISLINKKDAKKKLSKCVKTIQYSKKQMGNECNDHPATQIGECNKNYKMKRKLGKPIGKAKPRIRFKIPKEDNSPDEDSLDVVCKKNSKPLKNFNQSSGADDEKYRKSIIDTILNGTIENVIPEPCKTCSRSEQPERFHSHPKRLVKLASSEKKLEEKFRSVLTTKDTGKEEMRKSPGAKERTHQNSPCDEVPKSTPEKIKLSSKPPTKSNTPTELSSPESGNKGSSKNLQKQSSSSTKIKNETVKKINSKTGPIEKEEGPVIPGEGDLKFVTGCYICGKQVSPKLRIKHEQTCIAEWRAQNRLVSPDKRKPEPRRPDYRFTASGELDCEGTFESIWANHMDSLVPCKKCGRKFFPDRIERHESCCNNLPISVKYNH